MNKDYCPGYFDLVSGGVVAAHEDEDTNATRELEEELSIPNSKPNFLFKMKFDEPDVVRSYNYVYYLHHIGKVKP